MEYNETLGERAWALVDRLREGWAKRTFARVDDEDEPTKVEVCMLGGIFAGNLTVRDLAYEDVDGMRTGEYDDDPVTRYMSIDDPDWDWDVDSDPLAQLLAETIVEMYPDVVGNNLARYPLAIVPHFNDHSKTTFEMVEAVAEKVAVRADEIL